MNPVPYLLLAATLAALAYYQIITADTFAICGVLLVVGDRVMGRINQMRK